MFCNVIYSFNLLLTKVRKNKFIIVLLLILHISSIQTVNAQVKHSKYSIDNEQIKKRKVKKHFSFRGLFKKDAAKVAKRKRRREDRRRIKSEKASKKAIIQYQKKINNNNESGKKKKVYKRMAEFDKEAKRRRKHKHTKNFFQRYFSQSKKHKTKRKKE